MESDYRYYCRRAAEEHHRAQRAVTQAARERHIELAAVFAHKASLGATLQDNRVAV